MKSTKETWIDGYNFFHNWTSTADMLKNKDGDTPKFIEAMDGAVEKLTDILSLTTGKVILFQDGGERRKIEKRSELAVRYAGPGAKADDVILHYLSSCKKPGEVCVVTDDLDLSMQAKSLGAVVIKCKTFIKNIEREARLSTQSNPEAIKRNPQKLTKKELKDWEEFFNK